MGMVVEVAVVYPHGHGVGGWDISDHPGCVQQSATFGVSRSERVCGNGLDTDRRPSTSRVSGFRGPQQGTSKACVSPIWKQIHWQRGAEGLTPDDHTTE